jgi:hypothetical protein
MAQTPEVRKAAGQPARSARNAAYAKETAPEIPIDAACPAAARDISLASTLSARSLTPVM